MDPDQRYEVLEQRLVALEAKVESLSQPATGLTSGLPAGDRLAHLEALVTRLEENFSLIADIDTFSHLRDLLAAGNFKAADQETAQILMNAIGKTLETIAPSDIETFPLAPLRIVDRLWRKYSSDRFGLSTQLKIYREVGGDFNTVIAQDEAVLLAFCERVGWRKDGKSILQSDWEASLASPAGFLPISWWRTPYGMKIGNFIMARLMKGGF